jgi:hypothetical protein
MTRPEIESVVKEILLKAVIIQLFVDKAKDELSESIDETIIIQSVISTLQGDRDRLEDLMEAGYEQDKIGMNHIIRDLSDEIEKAIPPQA